jgi:hypothetical protein
MNLKKKIFCVYLEVLLVDNGDHQPMHAQLNCALVFLKERNVP